MNFKDRLITATQALRGKASNSMGEELALSRKFLKYGGNKPLVQDWSKVMMSDKEMYSGYPYAAIDRRANRVAQLAKYHLKTDALKAIQVQAKKDEIEVMHPYVDVIDLSPTFSNNKFWYDISTYLDLEGVYFLMAIRAVGQNIVGDIQQFKLLNPYDVKRIVNKETLEIGGYVEARNGMIREIPVQMIIEIRKLNPFSNDDPFAMTDAAKTAQFTIKQGGDYTRHSLKNNMASPGIISTDMLLEPEQFKNFVNRVTNQEKGLPLFGNGAGAITWDAMQIDMDKAGLKDITEMNRQELFAVSGVGKTMMAIEESGTTRETSKVQKDLFTEFHAMPQMELILDALNQDYKVHYPAEYAKNKYQLFIDNPLGADKDAEIKDVQIANDSYKLYDQLVADGYDREIAAKYAAGEITLEELGDPTNEPRPNPILEAAMLKAGTNPNDQAAAGDDNAGTAATDKKAADKLKADKKAKDAKKKADAANNEHDHDEIYDKLEVIRNEFDEEAQGLVTAQQGSLQNAITNMQGRVVNSVVNKVTKNAFEDDSDVISKDEEDTYKAELAIVVATFYGVLIPIFAKAVMARRAKEFGETGSFKFNNEVKQYIKVIASRASESHIDTIIEDLRDATKEAYDNAVQKEAKKLADAESRDVTDADLVLARKKALEGASKQEIINAITNEYGDISKNRAAAIARTETNRAFTQSQYQADIQFLKQNDLTDKAFKKWITRSANPCAVCQELASRPPIPFKNNFADLGEELTATYKDDKGKTKLLKQLVNFEALSAGNAHVNCSCRYMLIVED